MMKMLNEIRLLLLFILISINTVRCLEKEIYTKPSLLQNITEIHLRKKQPTLQQTNMILDTRTPPRYKYQLEVVQNQTELPVYHKGEAIPVTDPDLYMETKTTSTSATKDGISTWVLLSNNRSNNNKTKTSSSVNVTQRTTTASTVTVEKTKLLEKNSRKPENDLKSNTILSEVEIVSTKKTPTLNSTTNVTKKPKKSSNRRKNAIKKKLTLKNKLNVTESNVTNLIKSNKTNYNNKTSSILQQKPISTRIMNFFSREIVPSVGLGMMTVAVLTGIIAYFTSNTAVYRSYPDPPNRRHDYNGLFYNGANNNEELAVSKVLSQLSTHQYYHDPYSEVNQDRKLNSEIKAKNYIYDQENLEQPRVLQRRQWRKKRELAMDLKNLEKYQWQNINESLKNIRQSMSVLLNIYFKRPIELSLNLTRRFRELLMITENRFFSDFQFKKKYSRENLNENEIDDYYHKSELNMNYKIHNNENKVVANSEMNSTNFTEFFRQYMKKRLYAAFLLTKSVTETLNSFLEELKSRIENDLNFI